MTTQAHIQHLAAEIAQYADRLDGEDLVALDAASRLAAVADPSRTAIDVMRYLTSRLSAIRVNVAE